MLTADTQMDILTCCTTVLSSPAHQFADTVYIDMSKRIGIIDVLIIVGLQELACIITREAECHLRQIVRSEGEELSRFSQFTGIDSAARNFDHRTNVVDHLDIGSSDRLIRSLTDDVSDIIELLLLTNQRNHDFRLQVPARMFLVYIDGSVDDGTRLHDTDLRIRNIQTASTMTHHRVEFLQLNIRSLDIFNGDAHLISNFLDCLIRLRQELMQRRIQQTNRNAAALHSLEDAFEVLCLVRLKKIESLLTLLRRTGYAEHTDCLNTLLGVEEHVFRTNKTNTFRAELNCTSSIFRRIRIGTDLHRTTLISPLHEGSEVSGNCSRNTLNLSLVNKARITINGDDVTFVEGLTVHSELLSGFINLDFTAAGYTACTHTTGDNSRMRRHTAANRNDRLGNMHTRNVFRRRLKTNQNNLLAGSSLCLSILGVEHDCTASSTRSSSQTLGDYIAGLFLQACLIEGRMQKVIELLRLNLEQSLILRDQAFLDHVNRDLQSSVCRSLTIAALQHEQLAMLNRKLHILQIMVMILQCLGDTGEVSVSARHRLLELSNRLRRTDTGNDILALCVHQELTEQLVLTCSRVAREGNTGTTVIAHVSEDHFHDRYSGSPGIRNIVHPSIIDGTLVVPGTEDSHDCTVQLNQRILREVLMQVGSNDDSLAVAHTDAIKKANKKITPQDLYKMYQAGDKNLVFTVKSEIPVRDTLFNSRKDFIADSLKYIPFSGKQLTEMEAAIKKVSGVDVPLFEARMPYKKLLKGLDNQLRINLDAERKAQNRFEGLQAGSISAPNNNAGNWE